tara:strand:+ start:21974 stop:23500 length:1527 start_codon:yes stop_codon:yes gene_type:complete
MKSETNLYSNSKKEVLTFLQYINVCATLALLSDPAYQANSDFPSKNGGSGRWSQKDAEAYIRSLLSGSAVTSFVFACIVSCWEAAVKANKKEDIEYWKKWIKKFPEGISGGYMVLDSWNRQETLGTVSGSSVTSGENEGKILLGFIHDKITVPHGTYQVITPDNKYELIQVDESCDKYSTLDEKMKYHLHNHIEISTVVFTNIGREKCSSICRSINEGVHFTKELFRNTSTSYVAEKVRELPKKYKEYLIKEGCKWFTDNALTMRKADAWFAQLLWMFIYDWTKAAVTNKKLDLIYQIDKLEDSEVNAAIKFINHFFDDIIFKTKNKRGSCRYLGIKNKIVIQHLYHIYKYWYLDGYVIPEKNLNALYDKLTKEHNKLWKSKKKYTTTKTGSSVESQYKKLITGIQMGNARKCNELLTENFKIEEFLIKRGPRVVSDNEKTEAAVSQDWMTPAGTEIDPERLHTGDYEKGHGKLSYKESYTSDPFDTYVETRKENRSHGSSPIRLAND